MKQAKKVKALKPDRGTMSRRIGTRSRPYIEPREWPPGTLLKDRIDSLLDNEWRTIRELADLADSSEGCTREYIQILVHHGRVECSSSPGANGNTPHRYRKKQEETHKDSLQVAS